MLNDKLSSKYYAREALEHVIIRGFRKHNFFFELKRIEISLLKDIRVIAST